MNISDPVKYIRQQQIGQFRRPEDGREPYAYANDKKLESLKELDNRSVYVNNEKIVTFEKDVTDSDFPRLFDYNAGLKSKIKKIDTSEKEENFKAQYDNTGKKQVVDNKPESLIDLLA